MHRFTVAAVTVVGIGFATLGGALPAAAASVASCHQSKVLGPNGVYIDRVQAFAASIKQELRQMGYAVSMVEPWGGCVKATIEDGGGREHMEFFDPDTLEPLSTN